MTIKSWSWHQKYVMTPKIRHYVKKLALTSKCSWCKKHHDDKMFVITSKGLSWHQKDVIMSRSVSWCQKFCHDVKNTPNACHEVKNTSWCQKVCHDFKKSWRHDKNMSWHQKVSYDVKNMSWRQKVRYTSKTRRDVKILAPILHFYDVSSPSYQWVCVFHKFGDFNIRPIPVVVLYPDMSIDSFVTIRPHLTKLCCDIILRTHIHTQRQTDRHAAETLVL